MVLNITAVTDLSAGWTHNCARTMTGQVYCWGDNSAGQLGDGSVMDRLSPVTVNGL
jgi:alpha-tubulin suppressor-like RCC1 family protein